MPNLYKYRYTCSTEGEYIYEWREESEGVPTQCKNDPAHSIDASSITIIETQEDNEFKIQEEEIKTGGHFQTRMFKLTASPNGWTELDLTWDHPVSILDAEFITTSDMTDDELQVVIAPNTIIGAITAAVSSSDTILTVQQSVIDNIQVGYGVNITDLTNSDDLGVVTAIDKVNLQITVSVAATQSFSPATPTYVRMSPYMAREYIIGHAGRYTIGQGKIGGSYLPAGKIMRIRYNNKHASETRYFYAELDYLY